MKVLVTGAHGKVGRAAVAALQAAGHDVTASDVTRPAFDTPAPDEARYYQAELTDAGQVYGLVRGHDAVVHCAAIPEPTRNAPEVVFGNNLMSLFHVIEACVRFGVSRLVNLSSETVPGFFFPEREFLPAYVPVDERHPVAPQDPYALAKHFGEQLCDAAVRRSDLRCTSIRPSWVQTGENYQRNLSPLLGDRSQLTAGIWAYIDCLDLADAIVLAAECELEGHEVFYIASPDNVGGRDLAAAVHEAYGNAIEVRALDRVDASSISTAKAQQLLGWRPTRGWRDHLNDDGTPLHPAPTTGK